MPTGSRALVLTYTTTNQAELRSRLRTQAGDHSGIEVAGWYSFLLRDFVRPFLPFKFPCHRVRGLNFDGRPNRFAKGLGRFIDSRGDAYACELARLASELVEASGGGLTRRLECIYDEILIDEVQDLAGHDWEIIDALLTSSVPIRMVGDIRQSVISTNARTQKNKQYAYTNALSWFRERETRGHIQIFEQSVTWRCHPLVASFSDTIFDQSWGFPTTSSMNATSCGHDGVFLVRAADVDAYLALFEPLCLRDSANSGKSFKLDYLNFRLAKGMSREHILIAPTAGITKFLSDREPLAPLAACKFYVAVTRAQQSVGIIVDGDIKSDIPYWCPSK